MPAYGPGPTTPYDSLNAIITDIFGIAINWYVNRTPLTSRFPKLPVGSPSFKITNDNYRPRTVLIDNGAATGTGTTFTVADGSSFVGGDVIQVEDEQMLVGSVAGNVLTVTRAYAGTSNVTHADGLPVTLISNTRTGAEVDLTAISRTPVVATQWCQTIQHAYQVGGALQSTTNYVSGLGDPLDRDRMLTMQHVMDDFESACYYGKVVANTGATVRPQMQGLQNLIATNKTTTPTNASAYKPADLYRDTIQKCFSGGGQPSVMLVSSDFLTGLAMWGNAPLRVNAGSNVYGTSVELLESPFLPSISIVPAPLLKAGTAICLSARECRLRIKRPLADYPRGRRGDAYEGDMIMEGAVELDNEAHHAWVQGITTFAAP